MAPIAFWLQLPWRQYRVLKPLRARGRPAPGAAAPHGARPVLQHRPCSKWQQPCHTKSQGEPAHIFGDHAKWPVANPCSTDTAHGRPSPHAGAAAHLAPLRSLGGKATLLLALLAGVAAGLPGDAGATETARRKPQRAICPGPNLNFKSLAPGLWWLPGAPGDANAHNRGQVSNLVLAQQGQRLWLLGSGPTAAFGRNLACQVQRRWGRPVTDVISPWPHPELVLGAAGLASARHWGHADVAAAMQQRCEHCVARLREQLGLAAADLGPDPVRLPQRLLHGSQGRLGPWRWWLLSRGEGFPVTVWQWGDTPLRMAPGLLWGAAANDPTTGAAAPDARDADVQAMARATDALTTLPRAAARTQPLLWLGEQGAPGAELAAQHQRYWAGLLQAVDAGLARGGLETDIAAPAPPVPADDPRHALNWQRAWRQLESAAFQRSLR